MTEWYREVLFSGGPLNGDTLTIPGNLFVFTAPVPNEAGMSYELNADYVTWDEVFTTVDYEIMQFAIPGFGIMDLGMIRGHPSHEALPMMGTMMAWMAMFGGGFRRQA